MNACSSHAASVKTLRQNLEQEANYVPHSSDPASRTGPERHVPFMLGSLVEMPRQPESSDREARANSSDQRFSTVSPLNLNGLQRTCSTVTVKHVSIQVVLPLVADQMGVSATTRQSRLDRSNWAGDQACPNVLGQIELIQQMLPHVRSEPLACIFRAMRQTPANRRVASCRRVLEEVASLDKQYRLKPFLTLIGSLGAIPAGTRGDIAAEVLSASATLGEKDQTELIKTLAHGIGGLEVERQAQIIESIFLAVQTLANVVEDSALSETDIDELAGDVVHAARKYSQIEAHKKFDLIYAFMKSLPRQHRYDVIETLAEQVPTLSIPRRREEGMKLIVECKELDLRRMGYVLNCLADDLLEMTEGLNRPKRSFNCVIY